MSQPRIGELFAGYGGLGMGVQAALDGDIAWYSEIDKGALKILNHRFPGVPNIGDITTVDWSQVEPVDILTGGFPCQDVSNAGNRAGLRPDTRSGLWAQFAYAIDQLRPSLVVIENERLGRHWWARQTGRRSQRRTAADWSPASTLLPTPGAYDAERGGPQHPDKRREGGHGHGKSLAIELQRVQDGWGPYTAAMNRWAAILGRPAPSPDDPVAVREFMMGLPAGWVADVPGITRGECLKALGNGVVIQQSTAGVLAMLERIEAAA